MRTLLKLTRALRSSQELEPALQLVADAAHALVPAEGTSVRVLDEDRAYFVAIARAGHAVHQSANVKLQAGQGVLGWVATHRRLARVDDTRRDPRFQPRPDQARDVRSLVCVPILAGETLGVLGASHTGWGLQHHELLQLWPIVAPMLLARLRQSRQILTLLPNRRHSSRPSELDRSIEGNMH
jgi:GAF domain-containing protein